MSLRYRTAWLVLGWLMVAVVWYLSLMPKPPAVFNLWDKLNHFIAYAGLMGWFGQLYRNGLTRLWVAAGFIVMGVAVEIFQGMGATRMFEYNDMLANTLGVLLAMLILSLHGDGLLAWFEKHVLKV